MIEIRKAQQTDLQGIASVLRVFRDDPVAPEFARVAEDTRAGEFFICKCIPHTFVAIDDGRVVGVIMSHIGAVPVNPNAKYIEESHWYVEQKYRTGSVGYRLFAAWKAYALSLKAEGQVSAVLVHTMVGSPVDLTRHGCVPLQTTFEVVE